MLADMTSAELTEWIAYEELYGTLGAERDDTLNAILCATVANANRGKKSKKANPKQFLPKWNNDPLTVDQQLEYVEQLNEVNGGTRDRYTPTG